MSRIVPIPCLNDNYAYLVICEATRECAIVDPSEAAPVLAAVKAEGVTVKAIWNTHHHVDHVGGNDEIVSALGVSDVVAHVSDREKKRVPAQTTAVDTGDRVHVGEIEARIVHIPAHTLGAIAYVLEPRGESPSVFTGDTMFLGGCGRIFEGTPAQMHTSLQALATLPDDTRVYCGHEYTESNLRFAAHVEPSNKDVGEAAKRAKATRLMGKPTVPGRMGDERKTNPFLRVDSAEIRAKLAIAKDADGATALGAIRAAKDNF